jgi:hypothetical protein
MFEYHRPSNFRPFPEPWGVQAELDPTLRPRGLRVNRPLNFRPEKPFIGYLASVTQTLWFAQTIQESAARPVSDILIFSQSVSIQLEVTLRLTQELEFGDYVIALLFRNGLLIGGGGSVFVDPDEVLDSPLDTELLLELST